MDSITASTVLATWLEELRPRVLRCGFDAAPAGRRVDPINAQLEVFDLWHVADGAGAVRLNGAWHEFQAGQLVTLFPGDRYEAEAASVSWPFRVSYAYLSLVPGRDRAFAEVVRSFWPVVLDLRQQPALGGWFRQLLEWSVDPAVAAVRRAAVTGTCWLILDAVFDGILRSHREVPDVVAERMEKARRFIEANLGEPIQLEDIAIAAGVSARSISSAFRCTTGMSPVAFLLRRRLEAAQVMLARGERPKAVCAGCGFRSLQYFSRFFRGHTGLSPREFARQHRRLASVAALESSAMVASSAPRRGSVAPSLRASRRNAGRTGATARDHGRGRSCQQGGNGA